MAAAKKTGLFETHSVAPMVAGVSAGVVSTSLLLPLDVIKVRLNADHLYFKPAGIIGLVH